MVGLAMLAGGPPCGAGGRFPCLALGAFQFFPAEVGEPVADVDQVLGGELNPHGEQVVFAGARASVERDAGVVWVGEDQFRGHD